MEENSKIVAVSHPIPTNMRKGYMVGENPYL